MLLVNALKQMKTAVVFLILFTGITGLLYPYAVTGLAQVLFPWKANGSIVQENGKAIGSRLIGQFFDSPEYFWGRPSATTPTAYNAANSSGSNMGPSNPDYLKTVQARIKTLKESNPSNNLPIPIDLVTASGSGLDPHISPDAAVYQIPRIAKLSHISETELEQMISQFTEKRFLGIWGEPRVNVLALNLALNQLRTSHERSAPKP